MYPKFVSFLGASGLASALAYFVGVYLAFDPAWEQWAEFFVPWSVPLLFIPYVLLIGHLFLRTRLGEWFVERGEIAEAKAYCEERLDHNLLRSRKEALFHRVALARAYLVEQDYAEAEALLATGYSIPKKGQLALDIQRWRMEIALRADNLLRCRQAWSAVAELTRPRRSRAYVLACRAELAAREGERSEFEEAIEEALWADPKNERIVLSELVGSLRFSSEDSQLREALDLIEPASEHVSTQLPGRLAEVSAFAAELHLRLGEVDEARARLAEATDQPADPRADYELGRVRELIEEQVEQI
ncbi:MAG: hypothetical protein ACLFVJ_11835 [Persicimonas sp.]